ncbi:hypothetical protein F5Y06DRAFT_292109 [Hypoxylon sp. FL0890]|nr:hypothetical protein F5Y06DRAFT_292109 [Hypoxylon sp. FL0890]
MEHHRLPRHSSSHGTLRSSYSHGRSAQGPSPVRPLHKPLRSVNENSVLLPSPGALESMLKTTTETGDIGIFSIRPVPPSPKRKDTLSEIGQQYLSPRPSIDELQHRDNAKKPSSYRDTTSEIISMYGSESHKSATSTLTPTSSEEIGQRSYSMTTCGSRHLSHHRSTTTLQSQMSGGPLQRPRSPFPYPTRLKRPGVRPASPALTESGRVDYSRMVEIDRTSYRTAYGPFKPFRPPMPRRPPPLGLRNQSTVSLPSQGLLPCRYGPPGPPSIRTHSATSMASWSGPYREGLDNFSLRTSSLTSVVNVYHRFPNRAGPSSLPAAVPRYYDYTEEFESRQPRAITPVQPFAPVPNHVANFQRPLVLRETDDNLEITFERPDTAFFEPESQDQDRIDSTEVTQDDDAPIAKSCQTTLDRAPSPHHISSVHSETTSAALDSLETDRKLKRGSDIDLLPSQAGRDSMDTFNPNLDLESKDAPTYRYTDYRSTVKPKTKVNLPERQVQVQDGGTPTIRSEQGVILRDDTQDETPVEEGLGESGNIGRVEEQIMSRPQRHSDGLRSCSEPAQSPSKNPNNHDALLEDQHKFVTMNRADSRYSKKDALRDEARTTILNNTNRFGYSVENGDIPAMDAETSNNKRSGVEESHAAPAANQAPVIAQRQKFQRHKRNQAIPRISTSSLSREDNEGFPYISPSCSTTPIVSPKPISPARQLKLKNSIPQLMKALPPVPGDPDYVPPPTPSILSTSSDGDFSEVLAPFRFPDSSSPRSFKDTGVIKLDSTPNNDRDVGVQKHVPRLRLKAKMSNDSGATDSSDTRLCNTDIDHSWPAITPNPILQGKGYDINIHVRPRNRLKLRSSRSTTASTPLSGTVRRNTGAEESNLIVDIARQNPQDLFTVPPGSAPALHSPSAKPSQRPLIVHLSRGSTPDKFAPTEAGCQPLQKATSVNANPRSKAPYDSRSMETCASSNVRYPHDLKRRWSNIRDMLVRPSDSVSATSDAMTTRDTKETGADQNFGLRKVKFANTAGRLRRRNAFGRRVRSKVFKWVRDAKTAVRACAKRNRGT